MRPALRHAAAKLAARLDRVSTTEHGFTSQARIARALAECRALDRVYSTSPFRH